YNKVNHKNVGLLGWNPKTRSETFVSQNTSDYGAFSDTGAAAHITANLISQGADIVMPVDGQGGEHGAGRAAERAPGVLLIGVDSDQHFSAPQYEALWLTSVLKVFRRMVYVAMGDVVHDRFQGGVLGRTLISGASGLRRSNCRPIAFPVSAARERAEAHRARPTSSRPRAYQTSAIELGRRSPSRGSTRTTRLRARSATGRCSKKSASTRAPSKSSNPPTIRSLSTATK